MGKVMCVYDAVHILFDTQVSLLSRARNTAFSVPWNRFCVWHYKKKQSSQLRETMESAWKEVENMAAGPGAGVGDPDLQAVWDDQDDAAGGIETLEGVWGRTAARLEAGEGSTKTG